MQSPRRNLRTLRRRDPRRGAAVVEFAVCLPVMVLLIFASLEGANMLFVRQATVQAAYEAVKSAARSNGSTATATTIGQDVLAARNITLDSLTFNPPSVNGAAAGTPIVCTVRVQGDSRSIIGFGPFRGLVIEAQATMIKE
ncbi:MAG: pilus assembly protein [Pirellulaceae bacterium]